MNRINLSPRLLAFFTAAFCAFVSQDLLAQAKPILSLDSVSHDFGTVAQGTKVVHDFVIKNTGKSDLVVQRVAPSCGCTATQLASPIIKPGATEKMQVSFDTSGFVGEKTKTVLITSNDADNPEQVVTLRGRVSASYSVNPARIDFGDISSSSSEESRQREVTLSIENGSNLSITKITSLSPHLKTTVISQQENKAVVRVEVAASAPQGELRDRVLFELDRGRIASINVPINASIKGDLRFSQKTISFGVVEGDEVLERRIQFENKGAHPVKIEEITTSSPGLTASMVEVQPGRQGVLVVKLDPKLISGDLKATVDVKTDDPSESVVSLNVFSVAPPR